MDRVDSNIFRWAPTLVGCVGTWLELSGLVEAEGDGPPEALAGPGPNLVYEANRGSDDAS